MEGICADDGMAASGIWTPETIRTRLTENQILAPTVCGNAIGTTLRLLTPGLLYAQRRVLYVSWGGALSILKGSNATANLDF